MSRTTQAVAADFFRPPSSAFDRFDDFGGFCPKENYDTQSNAFEINDSDNESISYQPIVISPYKGVEDFWGKENERQKPSVSYSSISYDYLEPVSMRGKIRRIRNWVENLTSDPEPILE